MLKCYESDHVRPRQDRFKFLHLVFDSTVVCPEEVCIVQQQCVWAEESRSRSRSKSENSLFLLTFSHFFRSPPLLWQPQENKKQGKKNKPTAGQQQPATQQEFPLEEPSTRGKRKSKGSSCSKVRCGAFFLSYRSVVNDNLVVLIEGIVK